MKQNNYMEAFAEGISFIRRWWTDKKEDWVGALDEFYPALGLANFTNWQLEQYMKAAAKGEAYLPPDLEVVDDNGSLTIRVKGG